MLRIKLITHGGNANPCSEGLRSGQTGCGDPQGPFVSSCLFRHSLAESFQLLAQWGAGPRRALVLSYGPFTTFAAIFITLACLVMHIESYSDTYCSRDIFPNIYHLPGSPECNKRLQIGCWYNSLQWFVRFTWCVCFCPVWYWDVLTVKMGNILDLHYNV